MVNFNNKKVLTMAEYIEREALLCEIERREALMVGDKLVSVDAMKSFIKNRPAADVAPVWHGRWIEKDKYDFGTFYDCSICGNRILDNGHSWNYCPNCGAKMDGGTN